MQYRLYSGPRGAEQIRAIEKDKMLFKAFTSLDEALGFAQHLDRTGQTALLIEGDDGSSLRPRGNRRDAAARPLCPRRCDDVGLPKTAQLG